MKFIDEMIDRKRRESVQEIPDGPSERLVSVTPQDFDAEDFPPPLDWPPQSSLHASPRAAVEVLSADAPSHEENAPDTDEAQPDEAAGRTPRSRPQPRTDSRLISAAAAEAAIANQGAIGRRGGQPGRRSASVAADQGQMGAPARARVASIMAHLGDPLADFDDDEDMPWDRIEQADTESVEASDTYSEDDAPLYAEEEKEVEAMEEPMVAQAAPRSRSLAAPSPLRTRTPMTRPRTGPLRLVDPIRDGWNEEAENHQDEEDGAGDSAFAETAAPQPELPAAPPNLSIPAPHSRLPRSRPPSPAPQSRLPQSQRPQQAPVSGETTADEEHPEPDAPEQQAAGRVKTRLLGFHAPEAVNADPFARERPTTRGATRRAAPVAHFPVGWLIVEAGPGRGTAFALFDGMSTIGRGDGQTVQLDLGDTAISRDSHAAIAYDDETRTCYLGHGGKANLVRVNGRPLLSTEPINHGDRIRIGETTLMFVALCGPEFSWSDGTEEGAPDATAL